MTNSVIHAWSNQLLELNSHEAANQSFQEREVWNCRIGINVGHEQNGNPHSFLRPVLVIQRFGEHLFWAVPLSTKIQTTSQHHHLFTYDNKHYSALVTQLRVLDAKRLVRQMYVMDAENFYQIKLRLARYILRS